MLIPKNVHHSWNDFFTEDMVLMLENIENEIGIDATPNPPSEALFFFTLDLNKISIITVGLDPYTKKGIATGRAFEVGGLSSWNDKFRQVSLKNIIRLIHKEYNDINTYEDIKKYSEIQNEITKGNFKILPPNEIFKSWEEQGAIFLNIYPTCKIGSTCSHKVIWSDFSSHLLNYISENKPDLIWFLWGKNAIENKKYIKYGTTYECRHPMMCSQKYKDDFLKSTCFKDTKNIINWLGR